MTTIRGISESRDDHFEAVFVRSPRVRDVLEGDIVGLRVDDPVLTHVCSGLVTTDTFLYIKLITRCPNKVNYDYYFDYVFFALKSIEFTIS